MARYEGERVYAGLLMLTAAALVVLGITILPHRDPSTAPMAIDTPAAAARLAAPPK